LAWRRLARRVGLARSLVGLGSRLGWGPGWGWRAGWVWVPGWALALGLLGAANRPRAAGKTAPRGAETLGSFKPRYEIS
jgi:hypothetical protein